MSDVEEPSIGTTNVTAAALYPAIDPSDADRAVSVIGDIAEALSGCLGELHLHGPSLANGACGVALFFEYMSRSKLFPQYDGLAEGFMHSAIEYAQSERMNLSLFTGICGVTWTLWHLAGTGAVYAKRVDTSPLRDGLAALVAHGHDFDEFDLMRGLVGFAATALEDEEDIESRRTILRHVAQRLEARATTLETGFIWLDSSARNGHETPSQYVVNLGVAHGVAGVIVALAAGVAEGEVQAVDVLRGASEWLLARDLNTDDGHFAWEFDSEKDRSIPTRSAWCYGDPGISSALYVTGSYSSDAALMRAGHRIAATAARRKGPRINVQDAGLCHGSAGLAHIFRGWYARSGDEVFLTAARAWYRATLDYQRPGHGIGGFTARLMEEDVPVVGFLGGAAGVGLALLGGLTNDDTAWDRALLLSPCSLD